MAGQELGYLSREQELIEQLKSIIGPKYLGDDCARVAGNLLLTSDSLVEGSHFLLNNASLQDIGWKAMAVNLSDIAAMAGRPRYALVAVTVHPHFRRQDFIDLYNGIAECARTYQTAIVGGDISSGKVLSLTITIVGDVNERGCLLRSSAKPQDVVVVTGHFGASAAGLAVLLSPPKKSGKSSSADYETPQRAKEAFPVCINKHLRPLPRFEESWQLIQRTGQKAALMDASDGLADALAQITRASGVGMEIDLAAVPIDDETRKIAQLLKLDPYELALYGGEDYELVACIAETDWQDWLLEAGKAKIPFTKIGKVTSSGTIDLMIGAKKGPALNLQKCFQHIAISPQ
jgi:thiamine-monophosphate kinase